MSQITVIIEGLTFLPSNLSTLLSVVCVGAILAVLLTNKSFTALTTILAIFACFGLMFILPAPLPFVIALEGYNLCYIIFLFINRMNRQIVKRLVLLSMLISSVMIFGLCILTIQSENIIGRLLILIGLLFKLGTVPFHTWILDVYEHSSFRIIAVTDGIMKIMLAITFVKSLPLIDPKIISVTHILGLISLAIGAVMALHEHNIKRWLGYLSIGHIGIIMFTAQSDSYVSVTALLYLISYGSCVITFCISKHNMLKLVVLCAMVGLPPFHTFFAKVSLLRSLLNDADVYTLSVIVIYFVFELIGTIKWIKYYCEFDNNQIYTKN